MKKQIIATAAAALVIAIIGPPAHASLTLPASGSGSPVFDNSSNPHTYIYSSVSIAGDGPGQSTLYTVNANTAQASGTSFNGAPYGLTGSITDNGNSLSYQAWIQISNTEDGFTSMYRQTTRSERWNENADGNGVDNPSSSGLLTAVPETSTVLAGLFLLLPLGFGIVRRPRGIRKG